ncbi:Fic family protein [Lacunimicrobium album]
MTKEFFNSEAAAMIPGKYETVMTLRGPLQAFVPNPLPPDWAMPTEIWTHIVTARESLAELKALGALLPNPELLLRPLQKQEAISTSIIEGTRVTPQQLMLFEAEQEEGESSHSKEDEQEVYNSLLCIRYGIQQLELLPFCNRLLKGMHEILMTGVRGANKKPGSFRGPSEQVQVGRYAPPPGLYVDHLMSDLERFCNQLPDQIDPLVAILMVHFQFEAIHPFLDGNGRVGRTLLSLMIYKCFAHTSPLLYMSPYFEAHRQEYYDGLLGVSQQGDWETWIRFCLNGVTVQAREAIMLSQQIVKAREQCIRSLVGATKHSLKLIDLLFQFPALTINKTKRVLDVTAPTAKKELEVLVASNIVSQTKIGARYYYWAKIPLLNHELILADFRNSADVFNDLTAT